MNCNEICTLYAAPNGSGDGLSPQSPGGDLQKLLLTVAELRGGGALHPITLRLAGGEYPLQKPLSLRSPLSNLVIESADPSDPAVLSGGRRITGFARATFNGVACFGVYLDEVKTGKWDFTDLYVDGLRADYTRWPSEGFLKMAATQTETKGLGDSSKWFIMEPADRRTFRNLDDCRVRICHYWVDERSPIAALDPADGRLELTYRTRFEIHAGGEYWFENTVEGFLQPNQWYLDKASGWLYYIPRDAAVTPESIAVYAPVTDRLLVVEGLADDHRLAEGCAPLCGLTLRGLTFAHTRGDYLSDRAVHGAAQEPVASDGQGVSNAEGVVTLRQVRGVALEDCRFVNYGLYGLAVLAGSRNVRAERCRFYDGGAGGVRINGGTVADAPKERTENVKITDCRITHCGRIHFAACGILLMNASDCELTHNEIGDLFYTGISGGWVWGYTPSVTCRNLIAYNHIYNLGQGRLSDMGGVYLLGAQPGTVVRRNRIHGVRSLEYGGWCLYTDEGSNGVLLEENLCYDCTENAYHQHYGAGNTVRGNILAGGGHEVLRISRPETHLSLLVEGNIFCSPGTPMAGFGYGDPDPAPLLRHTISLRRNLYFDTTRPAPVFMNHDSVRTLQQVQAAGNCEDCAVGDPLFVDPAHEDYTLCENSPAFALGFRAFDWTAVGPRE